MNFNLAHQLHYSSTYLLLGPLLDQIALLNDLNRQNLLTVLRKNLVTSSKAALTQKTALGVFGDAASLETVVLDDLEMLMS